MTDFRDTVTVFAPASTGNIGPGFDVLGMALAGLGDTVHARRIPEPKVVILEIRGDGGKLPTNARKNTAGIAAAKVLKLLKVDAGVELVLEKNIPGNGLGSSAASAIAGGFAVNALFGSPLSKADLLLPCAAAEASVSGGYFLDNAAASLFGGVNVTNPETREVISLGGLAGAIIVVATPRYQLLTARSRKVVPKRVPLASMIANCSRACAIVAAVAKQDADLFGRSIVDVVVEPARAPLIPGFAAVKRAALKAGALGCSISGAGSSVFAVTTDKALGESIGGAMQRAFERVRLECVVTVTTIDPTGARVVL
ncbi:MAG TPA: homoserine kinase [Nitrospiria bacterium]|nr:homoserine kinase [Nitrospiria bacterium]